ncbi:MAG: hypothetical protein K6E67_10380 [Prevotella sp.]|nr:hypothetical protein [Prevotella sp.]
MALIIDEQGFKDQMTVLQAASVVDGELGKRLREAIFHELKTARNKIASSIKFKNGDPRQSARAVKRYVAHKYLGGVVSILEGKKASDGQNGYTPPRTLRAGQRGGNRRPMSMRTYKVLNYPGVGRGFILRFVNSGTKQRAIERLVEFKKAGGGSKFKWVQDPTKYGNRGSIAPRNFFETAGNAALQLAIEKLSAIIDEEYNKIFRQ